MSDERDVAVGKRVRLRSSSHLVDLRSPFGRVVKPDRWDGYYVVRLDEPAIYHEADGTTRELAEIVEMADNMDVVGARAVGGAGAWTKQTVRRGGGSMGEVICEIGSVRWSLPIAAYRSMKTGPASGGKWVQRKIDKPARKSSRRSERSKK